MPPKTKSGLMALNKSQLVSLTAATIRASLAARLGKSFGGDRDLYEALGYKSQPDFKDYMSRYRRQDIAKAVINKPVNYSWMKPPAITESVEVENSEFEKRWLELVDKNRIFHYLSRVDKLAGIGPYAVLVIGVDDSGGFGDPLERASDLLYLTPVSFENAEVKKYEDDITSERYNLPTSYTVKMKRGEASTMSKEVHHTRVIHVAEEMLEDNITGTPRLEAVLNRLHDLELIVGGGAEMFWRGGFPGLGFKLDNDYDFTQQDEDDLEDEIKEYLHGLKRYLRLKGVTVDEIKQSLADPSGNVDKEIDLIACASEIPKRILLGSERGELASSMDEQSWLDTIDARRRQHCEPTLLRPLVDRLISVNILPEPKENKYNVDWPDLMAKSDKEKVDVGEVRSKSLKNYMESGGEEIMPIDVFLVDVLGIEKERADQIQEMLENVDRTIQPDDEDEE
jgi:hypothetical protein